MNFDPQTLRPSPTPLTAEDIEPGYPAQDSTRTASAALAHADTENLARAQRLNYIFRRVSGQANSSTQALQSALSRYRGVAP